MDSQNLADCRPFAEKTAAPMYCDFLMRRDSPSLELRVYLDVMSSRATSPNQFSATLGPDSNSLSRQLIIMIQLFRKAAAGNPLRSGIVMRAMIIHLENEPFTQASQHVSQIALSDANSKLFASFIVDIDYHECGSLAGQPRSQT
jgi:hypothetical protein